MEDAPLPLFVETTVHIWRQTMTNAVKRRIEQALNQQRSISSTYVKAEYINTYLRAAITVHNLLVNAESLDDAQRRWQGVFSKRTKLEVHHMMMIFMHGEHDKERILKRFRQLIETTILLYFDETMTEIMDATKCEASNARPVRIDDNYELPLTFPEKEAPEGLRLFLIRKQQQLADIEAAIQSNEEHWKSVKESLKRILNGDYALGIRAWEKIADIVIALEAHDSGSEVYTGNVKHFEPICAAINVPLKAVYPR